MVFKHIYSGDKPFMVLSSEGLGRANYDIVILKAHWVAIRNAIGITREIIPNGKNAVLRMDKSDIKEFFKLRAEGAFDRIELDGSVIYEVKGGSYKKGIRP